MNNVRIAIRDSTDSHNVAFFDNQAGIKYKSANLQRFLAGSASILTLKYNSKDIDSIRSGCKLAFRYKARDYWLNIMKFEKQGFEVEITACSLHLEMNNEERGAHKPDEAMSFAEYLAYYDPEHSVTLGINQVSDKKIKLEWTGTDTILARLFSIANSFDAELEFVTELNDDYSLKRHVLNVYKKGNLGSNKTSSPVRVGKELKVINYSDNIEDLRTAVRATGKNGLTIIGLNKKIYDGDGELLYYSSGDTVYAPQSRDRFPSVGQASNDNWIVQDFGETQYETKEALWGYLYGEIQKICLPKIEYKVTGAIDSDVGDTQTLIDDVHYEPPLYLKARVSELTDDILQGKVIDSTFINFERQYSQIADSLLKQVEALAEDAAPYIVRLSTDNGYNFKNGQGSSTITAKLEKYSKIVNASWKWLVNNNVISETSSVTINASQVIGTLNVVAVAIVDGNEVAREYITFTNSDDGVGIKSIKRYYTTNDQAEGVTAGGQNWSTKPTTVTADKSYMWSYDVITYTNDTSLVTEPAVIGARGDDGLDADTTGITEALDKAKQELTALSANIEKVRDDSLAAVEEAKQQLATVADGLSTAKQDLQAQASQLQAQASAQTELTNRVSTVEETANGTKATVSELSKTVDSNTQNITSVTARTKTVEDDLTSTKTTLSQVQTTANSASSKTATLETGLNGLAAKFSSLKIGGRNYLTNLASNWQNKYVITNGASAGSFLQQDSTTRISPKEFIAVETGKQYTISLKELTDADYYFKVTMSTVAAYGKPNSMLNADEWIYSDSYTFTAPEGCNYIVISVGRDGGVTPDDLNSKFNIKLEEGNIATDYSPNDADIESKVAEYKQTADQNYASLQSNLQALDGTVTANKATADQTAQGFSTRIESLETYKDGESTRANQYFESAKTETARQLTAERTAIANNYVAKSTYTNDVTGIRNDLTATTTTANTTKTNLASYQTSNDQAVASLQSNLQTANGNISSLQTKVEAVPGQITSAVSAVEGKIPTAIGGRNLWIQSQATGNFVEETLPDNHITGQKKCYRISPNQKIEFNISPDFSAKLCKKITFSAWIKYENVVQGPNSWNKFEVFKHTLYRKNSSTGATSSADFKVLAELVGTSDWKYVTYTYDYSDNKSYDQIKTNLRFILESVSSGTAWVTGIKVEIGSIPSDYSPAPEDYDSALTQAKSEIKQTTDAISASVSSLDKSTVKSASLTINADGIVMKAGKSTTDIANAIGSYFSVNQNAINLFSDKINVKGSMIVDGAITSAKIASKSINAAHLNGKIITADVIATGAIIADAIKAGAVTTSAMSANSINGDRITAGTLDAAKIKAGSITASQIASGTITSSQIKSGTIVGTNIAAGAITTNHLAAGSITADKIKAGSITADMFKGDKITSLNDATTLNLQTGEITFNNMYATINQTKGNYKSQISLFSLSGEASTENSWSSTNVLAFNSTKLTSATRYAGLTTDMFPNFSRTTLYGERIAFTGEAPVSPGPKNSIIITTNSDEVNFTNNMTSNSKGNWKYSMIMNFGTEAAINVPDIKLDGHFKSLTGILDDLCKKVGVLWV
ncbi:MAG: gp58-like family protein [Streptococcus sp.]|uniref:hypothetical protein n=1 Tax=Streptococcus sp. TaxID=1306 RepID=UPI00258E4364|nr:hypothetical protein [Streptococcus sp.]MCR5051450.1 gp58-like family protein [Streptococcus sp.]